MTKKKVRFSVLFLCIILLFFCCIAVTLFYFGQIKSALFPVNPPVVESTAQKIANTPIGGTVQFSGTMTDFIDLCYVDATCSALVDGYWIVTNPGDVATPELQQVGSSNVSKEDIGTHVKVKAKKINEKSLTIVGSRDFYVLTDTN